jgi:hypothetical protein
LIARPIHHDRFSKLAGKPSIPGNEGIRRDLRKRGSAALILFGRWNNAETAFHGPAWTGEGSYRSGCSAARDRQTVWAEREHCDHFGAAIPRNREHRTSGGSVSPLEEHEHFILGLIKEQPDMTLDEIVAAMTKAKIPGSRTAVWRFLDPHGITFKENSVRGRPKAGRVRPRPPTLAARAAHVWPHKPGVYRRDLHYTDMVPPRGRSPRGERLIACAPGGHRKTITFVAAPCQSGMTAPDVIDGAMDGSMFFGYLEQIVVRTLERGETVVMDTLPAQSLASGRRLKRQVRKCFICRPIRPTCTQWKCPPPNW